MRLVVFNRSVVSSTAYKSRSLQVCNKKPVIKFYEYRDIVSYQAKVLLVREIGRSQAIEHRLSIFNGQWALTLVSKYRVNAT